MGAGRANGWGGGRALGAGACAVRRGRLGCPGPDQRPGDWPDGRQRWCGWGVRGVLGGHLREAGPPPTAGGWKQAQGGAPYLSELWPMWEPPPKPPPLALLTVVCHSAGRQVAADSWFGKGYLLWGRVAVALLGSMQPWLPWGRSALREERLQRASAGSGRGRAAESCCHGYGVSHGEAPWAL